MLKTFGSGAPVSGLLLAASIATTTPDAFAQPDSRYVSHAGPCSRTSACLQNGWFDVSVRVYDPSADAWTTAGFAEVDVGHEAALVYFYSATNLEMLVKVLDGNAVNGVSGCSPQPPRTLDSSLGYAIPKRAGRTSITIREEPGRSP